MLLAACGLVVCVFLALGAWQVQRLFWKLDLIETVEARAYGIPVAPPDAASFSANEHEYLRVSVNGQFQYQHTVFIKAVTELGPGFWTMTPLELEDATVWINRGFIIEPADLIDGAQNPEPREIVGLLRLSVPDGTLLEPNRPEIDRWVSADIAALSARAEVGDTLPYYIDAERDPEVQTGPRGGLTIVSFPNNHLVYALTWFAMAALLCGAMVFVLRRGFASREL